jgi:hypothetical protein
VLFVSDIDAVAVRYFREGDNRGIAVKHAVVGVLPPRRERYNE